MASSTTLKKAKAPVMHPTKNDLPLAIRQDVVVLLNHTLASTADLYSQAKQAHWNVRGAHFYSYHLLFDAVASAVEPFADDLAERITALGGTANGTVRMAASHSILTEFDDGLRTGLDFVTALSQQVACYVAHLRQAIETTDNHGDADTADLYTEISRVMDKQLWFLEAHLSEAEQG
jgi:starvation-inducible DNA-binding protein